MVKAVIFDLDDTLYYELDYVKSGFRAVSEYIAFRYQVDKDEFYQELLNILEIEGRGKTFNIALERFVIPAAELKKMIDVYRSHHPENIRLYEDAVEILNRCLKEKRYKIGIITDGNSEVQWNKIKSLGLKEKVDQIIVTDDFGVNKRKPHFFSYQRMLELLQVKAEEAVYVGDNPVKDFINARELGMKTVRIIREHGMHIDKRMAVKYEADYEINTLNDLDQHILK
ncbi:MAG: HAD-IA family hydrolase [Firmicutes bacterium]|nr:HAD-IA family hydrolase [Bacillota bacterium]